MLQRLAKLLCATLLACAATLGHAFPTPLPAPDLSARDFRNDANAVAVTAINVIGIGPSGRAYVAGAFTSVDGQARPHGIARLNVDGSLDGTWAPTLPAASVTAAFESPGGAVAIASASDLVLVPAGSGTGTVIHSAASNVGARSVAFDASGNIYAAIGARVPPPFGETVGAEILKFSPAGARDIAFELRLRGYYILGLMCPITPPPSQVTSLVIHEGWVYVGGDFTLAENARGTYDVGGALRASPVSGDADASWRPMGDPTPAAALAEPASKLTCFPPPSGMVYQIVPGANQTVYIAGPFTQQGRSGLGRFSTVGTGAVDSSWSPVLPPYGVYRLALDPGGAFIYASLLNPSNKVDGVDRGGIVAYSTAPGAAISPWDPGTQGVLHMAALADRLVFGGPIESVAGQPRPKLAAVPLAGAQPTGALVTLAPRDLDFGVVSIETTATRDITLGNVGDGPLVVQSIDLLPSGASAGLAPTHDCIGAVAPGAGCTIRLTLDPDIAQTSQATVRVVSNGSGTPQTTAVRWTLGYPSLWMPGKDYFASAGFELTPVGTTRTKTLSIANEGNLPLGLASIAVSTSGGTGQFSRSHDCPPFLAPKASCTLTIHFTPPQPGDSTGLLALTFSSRTHVLYEPQGQWRMQFELTFPARGAGPSDDSDGDGIPDGVEAAVGGDPSVKDNDIFASNRLFAMQQYRDFLAREGDAGGVAYWTNQLDAGATTRATMALGFLTSAEFEGTMAPVARLYFAFFFRFPDYTGLQYWLGVHRGGGSLESISDAFSTSPEFTIRYGTLDNEQFVDRVYRNVLGRLPDAAGLAHWKGRLDSAAMTRGQMMVAFSESAEYRALIGPEVLVTMAYIGMLHRGPDGPGFRHWVDYIDAGNSPLALINAFVAAPEYRARFLP